MKKDELYKEILFKLGELSAAVHGVQQSGSAADEKLTKVCDHLVKIEGRVATLEGKLTIYSGGIATVVAAAVAVVVEYVKNLPGLP